MENEREERSEEAVSGPIMEITIEEVNKAVKSLRSSKTGGPSEVVEEHFKFLEHERLRWVTTLLNKILKDERILQEWKKSQLVPIYKEKGDPMDCKNYRGIKLLEVGLKILEKVLDRRLREIIQIHGTQYEFQPGKGTIDSIFIIRQLQEKVLEKRGKLFLTFLDLEKAYDRVPRDVVYSCLRRREIPGRLVRLVKLC